MQINQLDHTYEVKIDLGDYQTGTAEFYVLAEINSEVTTARSALQDMATRNLRFAGAKLQDKTAPKNNSLGLDAPGPSVTKIGVGYGKKVKMGKGTSNRTIFHRIWGQLLPDDDPAESAAQLWQYVFDAYDEKMAQIDTQSAARSQAGTTAKPKTKPASKAVTDSVPVVPIAAPQPEASLDTPDEIREMVLALAGRYRGKGEATNRQRYPAMKSLECAVSKAYPAEATSFTGWILTYLFGNEGAEIPLTEYDVEAKHLSAIIRWSNRDGFKAEVGVLAAYIDEIHGLTNSTEKAF